MTRQHNIKIPKEVVGHRYQKCNMQILNTLNKLNVCVRVQPMPSIYRAWQLCFKMAVTLAHTKNEETGYNIVYSI